MPNLICAIVLSAIGTMVMSANAANAHGECVPVVSVKASNGGALDIKALSTMSLPDEWRYMADAARALMRSRTGVSLRLVYSDTASVRMVHDTSLGGEEYRMHIADDGIVVEAGGACAANWALSSLAQMVSAANGASLMAADITDGPRFAHRGLMIDCSRHFRTIAELQSIVDAMNLFKLNTLHLHLTDNQGWRLALDRYPEVAVRGTRYDDFPELSGKYYTPAELKQLVAYAQARGVEIIPEVDMPGHCLALLASMPQLSCRGGEFEPFPEERPQNLRKRAWENMLCVGNEQVYAFVDYLVAQLADIFPSRYLHLGGDEVSTVRWKECPRCQALYNRLHMTDLQQLQDYFTHRVEETVRRHGRTLMGWDEINDRRAADRNDVVTIWQRDAADRCLKAVERGMRVVMCPKDPCYFDFGYARNSTRKVYEWQPLEGIPDSCQHLVIGGQACLWTEFVATQRDVEHMLYPRLCALAEVLWNGRGGDFADFTQRLGRVLPMLNRTGVKPYDEDFGKTAIFDAESSQPRLLPGASIDTDMGGIRFYDKEYAYDGDPTTFFATPYSNLAGEHFTVTLNHAVATRRVGIDFDSSKEYPCNAELQASADGNVFERVAMVSVDGHLEARFKRKRMVKALRLVLGSEQKNRLSIREFYFH